MGWAARLTLLFAGSALAQQIGTTKAENAPKLTSNYCTKSDGCKELKSSMVADQVSRQMHLVGMSNVTCPTGNKTVCPTPEKCSQNCALEGLDYEYAGVTTEGNKVHMRLFNGPEGNKQAVAARIYLMAESGDKYQMFKLVNQEFSVDVDVSHSGCGVNAALYLIEMDEHGGQSDINKAGAKYGTGYCDAQCPKLNFINGLANLDGKGACCNEMDIFEGNRISEGMTPHPCNVKSIYACSGNDCSKDSKLGLCDSGGCGANPYANGYKTFYGPGARIDSMRPFTIVTQFLTKDGTAQSDLTKIRRLFIQDGKLINSATMISGGQNVTVSALEPGINTISEEYCSGAVAFNKFGGMRTMGQALARGMVLSISLWATSRDNMNWLDAGNSGTCSSTAGDPKNIYKDNPDAAADFSNMRWGDIGSTFDLNAVSSDVKNVLSSGSGSAASADSASSWGLWGSLGPADAEAQTKAVVSGAAQRPSKGMAWSVAAVVLGVWGRRIL